MNKIEISNLILNLNHYLQLEILNHSKPNLNSIKIKANLQIKDFKQILNFNWKAKQVLRMKIIFRIKAQNVCFK